MLCAGIFRREGWKTLDADPRNRPDYLAAIPPLPEAVKGQRWEEIEWLHGITSFYPWDGAALLREIHDVLEPGGKLILEQPDFRKAIEKPEWLFGDALLREPLLMNRWAYTPESLMTALRKADFQRVDLLPAMHHNPARDFRLEAYA
jgi:predicted SAM-dependent methyltransferase